MKSLGQTNRNWLGCSDDFESWHLFGSSKVNVRSLCIHLVTQKFFKKLLSWTTKGANFQNHQRAPYPIFIFFGPKDSKSAPAPFPAQLEGPPQNLTPPSSHLSSRKAAAQKKAKNATMCLALNVQWSYHSIAAMLSVKSAMMR